MTPKQSYKNRALAVLAAAVIIAGAYLLLTQGRDNSVRQRDPLYVSGIYRELSHDYKSSYQIRKEYGRVVDFWVSNIGSTTIKISIDNQISCILAPGESNYGESNYVEASRH